MAFHNIEFNPLKKQDLDPTLNKKCFWLDQTVVTGTVFSLSWYISQKLYNKSRILKYYYPIAIGQFQNHNSVALYLDGMVSHGLATETLDRGDAPAVACQYRGQALHTDTGITIKLKKILYYKVG